MPRKPTKKAAAKSSKPVTPSPSAVKRPPKKSAAKKAAKKKAKKRDEKDSSPIGSTNASAGTAHGGLTPSRSPKMKVQPTAVTPVPETQAYEEHKSRSRERQAKIVREGQDIGAIPEPANPKRRAKCERNLNQFYRTYFPDVFAHPWSRVHTRLIKLITMAVLMGCMLAVGIPRGFGKTSMCVRAVIWAICYRHHTLIMLFAATNEAAADLIKDIQTELTTNPLLLEDFPEICLPLIEVGSANQKGRGQLCQGEPTNVKVRSNELWTGDVLRSADGSVIPGACIWACGITAGGIRGKRRTVDGRVLRPTLGLADDCQTRSSAISPRQCNRRKNILEADLPGLPGQSNSWSFLSTWTVIEPDDTADWVLNREKAPDYHGLRERFLDAMPDDKAMEKWSEWNEIRIRCQQAAGLSDDDLDTFDDHDPLEPAHEFFDKHKKVMIRGAKVVWEYAYDPKRYRCALEKAMHWYYRNKLAFYSELQNDPAAFQVEAKPQLKKFDLSTRFGLHPRGTVPRGSQWLTVGIDVQGKVLMWSVRAWAQDSTSQVIEYGTWPGQNRQYFTLSDIRLTIDAHYSSLPTWEVRLAAALRDLLTKLFGQQWPREDGLQLSLTAGGVDANWQTDAVKAAVMASGFYGKVYPTHGRSFTTAHQTLNESAVRDRDIVGDNWRLRQPKQGDVQFVTFDTNVFKSQLRDRLMMNIAQPGALTLHLGPSHDMWADHICAERCHEKLDKTRNREYDEWMKLPNLDNHYLDCEVINNVVAGMLGIRLPIGAAALDAVKAIAAMPTSSHSNQNQNQPVPNAANYKPFAKKRS